MDERIEESWMNALKGEFNASYFKALTQFVRQEYQTADVWPEEKNIFRAYNEVPISKVKVVILGQDPYPTPGHAHGLSFSVEKGTTPLPKSLKNIYKEIEADLGKPSVTVGDLTSWTKDGVFLLNSCLTVRAKETNSHCKKGWEKFTDATIESISQLRENVVFLLWGANAKAKSLLIDQTKHKIMTSVHPSPLSAYRGFFGCKHFSQTNTYLESTGQSPINW